MGAGMVLSCTVRMQYSHLHKRFSEVLYFNYIFKRIHHRSPSAHRSTVNSSSYKLKYMAIKVHAIFNNFQLFFIIIVICEPNFWWIPSAHTHVVAFIFPPFLILFSFSREFSCAHHSREREQERVQEQKKEQKQLKKCSVLIVVMRGM